MSDIGIYTPYSTVMPFVVTDPGWVPESERERIASYQVYDEMYHNHPSAFKLVQRGGEDKPIYIPEPRSIVDATAHFFMKGLRLELSGVDEDAKPAELFKAFMDRENFYSKFHIAKQAGVARGDFVFHITANPNKMPGSRISINSVDPASYFPEYDDDDPDKLVAVNLVDQWMDDKDNTIKLKRQRYEYLENSRRVISSIEILELDRWWDPKERKISQRVMPPKLLPLDITTIPVYHFKNAEWDGQPYGSSELRGLERIFAAINQSVTDEEVALALEGLGVYWTTAPPPVDEDTGEDIPWEIAPGRVLEGDIGDEFRRVEGVGSVQPLQDHLKYLHERLNETTGTFRPNKLDVTEAESGIALALKFLPMEAKLEMRDESGKGKLTQMMFDWKMWAKSYEGVNFTQEIVVHLGEKLPRNREKELNELNNWLDRKIISRKFYRERIRVVYGIEIPEDIDKEILEEERLLAEARVFTANGGGDPTQGNQSNNRNRPNESGGTEADNGTQSAQQRAEGSSGR